MPLPEEQISKAWPAEFIDAGNLAIENGAFNFDVSRQPGSKLGKSPEDIPVSRYQLSAAALQMCERAETVDLQFVDEVVRIERFGTAGKPYRA